MEENVALDSKKQKKFDKSIKGIKKLLKKNDEEPHKPAVLAPTHEESKVNKKKRKRPERGLVYLSHIPHGFYEHEMTQYFKQFGMVTNVRVIRSPRTGRSKGYAFVEFREPAVAEIVAETMNNYLMGKRLIKAAIIPPEKQKHKAFRKHWTPNHNPTADRRIKQRKAYNADKTDAEHLTKAKSLLSILLKTKKKLSALGIDYDFFTPVDVPEPLLNKTTVKVESEEVSVKNEPETKKKKKEPEAKKVKTVPEAKGIENEPKGKKNKNKKTKVQESGEKFTKVNKPEVKPQVAETKNKKETKKTQDNGKEKQNEKQKKIQDNDKVKQNEKQKKIQGAGAKLPENFIKVGEDSEEDSDSSLDFDSDEYEKMMEHDSDASSGDESEDDEDGEGEESDDEDSDEEIPQLVPIKEKKGKKPIVALPPPKKAAKPANESKTQKLQVLQAKASKPAVPKAQAPQPKPQAFKRKNHQPEVSPKKPKFEKKNNPRNKQFKKKNKA